ncbi:hypothetical protein [Gilvimarinus xylanilyticus]|uniref:Antitoxin Xre/MbcA/ParS-like toxin-binding domain-containing protein n=1 Tax=Gilvimarinus xylanilyticus TaxID=2944139 RepID=A0A9X2KUJ7_9GAMM|nr:hypothetical protein [Gilvimarinus xylanilyticus]MCP8899908.1 hypothetical protein [Gilvimarinus xylanilyticus]
MNRAAENILTRWGISPSDQRLILGVPESENAYEEKGEYIIAIDDALKRLFENPKNIDQFMTMKNYNPPFCGLRPIDLLLSGDIRDFKKAWLAINAVARGHL